MSFARSEIGVAVYENELFAIGGRANNSQTADADDEDKYDDEYDDYESSSDDYPSCYKTNIVECYSESEAKWIQVESLPEKTLNCCALITQ